MKHAIPFLFAAGAAWADAPVVTEATTDGAGRFSVTLTHPDTGWDHYADGWRIEDATGKVLGLRVLAHPHVTEQPFTRSLSGVDIPAGTKLGTKLGTKPGTKTVFIRARCLVDGWSDEVFELRLD
ncbi:MAG: hypothetical protein ACRBB0_00555 [Pelagimonas sp.]|uniref:hypothetical protein n=1 Tax=Pelagimonas sp. TaxID=2073170 RepID=UPI003D6A7F95